MGACYSSLSSWYNWALGPSVLSTGRYRYPSEGVDGEPTIEFHNLIDADPALLELGQGVPVITDREREIIGSGRYDDIVIHQATDGTESRQRDEEMRLQREQEAMYEAKREQARAARQAQSMEASRAAATAVAVAQATNLALRQNGEMYISSAAPPASASPRTEVRSEGAASSQASTDTTDGRDSSVVAPLSLNGLRSEPKLDPARAQIHAFEQSMSKGGKAATSTSPSTDKRMTSGGKQSSTVFTASTTSVLGATVKPPSTSSGLIGSNPRMMQREPPPFTDTDLVDGLPTTHADQLARFEAAGFHAVSDVPAAAASGSSSVVSADTPAPAATVSDSGFSIVDDEDDDDFESFLESVQAQAMASDSAPSSAAASSADETVTLPDTSTSTLTRSVSPPPGDSRPVSNEAVASLVAAITSGDEDEEFTSFEDSVR
ncbi:uncharacterized protein LOC135819732 [Sycon ciliatum]|uniref:uncharacterized protein LOC135819732 n=1 Tax=Sycon ciliatum TaxID=27933 RepID=UPI0031F69CB2